GLLSITVCQPVLSLTLAASRRATASVVPPGGKGTTTRIGPLGQSLPCAGARPGRPIVATPAASAVRRDTAIMNALPVLLVLRRAYRRRAPPSMTGPLAEMRIELSGGEPGIERVASVDRLAGTLDAQLRSAIVE